MEDAMKLSLGEVALGRYAVTLLTADERTNSGLYLVAAATGISSVGRIIARGPAYRSASDDEDESPSGPNYEVGQIVVFGKYIGNEITLNDLDTRHAQKFLIINESDILCTLTEDTPDGTAAQS